jgi:pro-apoptotic serine protease NMA111
LYNKVNISIQTQSHVVRPGPVETRAKFNNHEEIALTALWYDPEHDFGFYKFNPNDLKFQDNLTEIKLAPEKAKVGISIRVIGNNAGEQLSILSGTLAKLNRAAPKYTVGSYNDYNTFYYQAASMTSGGSSGSPVIDQDGDAVALNAGSAKRAASSFYLPLDRAVRALALLRKPNCPIPRGIPRGTIQTIFKYETYDEVRRLGLNPETEALVRKVNPEGTGMLTALKILPKGPASKRLLQSDIVIRINGKLVLDFVQLEQILDDHVNQTIELEIDRVGTSVIIQIQVQDFYDVTPDSFIEFGGGAFHNTSYQLAVNYSIPISGVVLAIPGYCFRRAGITSQAMIEKIGTTPITDLDTFQSVISSSKCGSFLTVKYYYLSEKNSKHVGLVQVDFKWFLFQRWHRDIEGIWRIRSLAHCKEKFQLVGNSTTIPQLSNSLASSFGSSLVMVKFATPYQLSGLSSSSFLGAGIILDSQRGIILVDKCTVPYSLGDITVIIAGSIEIQASVIIEHPLHSFTLIRYDPEQLGNTPLKAIEISEIPLQVGDHCSFVGLNHAGNIITFSSDVTQIEPIRIPPAPRFRETNMLGIYLVCKFIIFFFYY